MKRLLRLAAFVYFLFNRCNIFPLVLFLDSPDAAEIDFSIINCIIILELIHELPSGF